MNPIFILLLFLVPVHDIHVSVSEINIDTSYEINISIKIFYDDLLNAVGLTAGASLPKDYTSADDLIIQYLSEHFYISINGKKILISLSEINAFGDAVWIDLIGSRLSQDKISKIEIFNDIFIDLFDDQSNLIKLDHVENTYSDLLNDNKTKFIVKI